jgi:hypothetical protein
LLGKRNRGVWVERAPGTKNKCKPQSRPVSNYLQFGVSLLALVMEVNDVERLGNDRTKAMSFHDLSKQGMPRGRTRAPPPSDPCHF